MAEHAVVIVGAGPTGLMLAGELALAGIDVAITERRTRHDLVGSRAGGMTPRTIEVLDQRGIADRFLSEGTIGQLGHYSGIFFDVADLPTRHNYGLGLQQHRIERILADWVSELGVPIQYGREVAGFTQDATGVDIELADAKLRASYLVGCDGGRSLVRKSAAIAFPGWEPSTSCLVADVDMTEEPPWGLHRDGGFHSFFQLEDGGPVRVMVTELHLGSTHEPTLSDISQALTAARGTDYVRGHEKVPTGGQVEVSAGGQIKVSTPCSSCRSGTAGPDGDGEGANQSSPPSGSSIEICEGPHGHHFRLSASRVIPGRRRVVRHHS